MAEVVEVLGRGGQRFAERYLGWNRKTIRKGVQELSSEQPMQDRFADRGRNKIEVHLPLLLERIRASPTVKPIRHSVRPAFIPR